MTSSKRQSFTWPFCLSFACILTWFIPMQALFAVPTSSDDGPNSFVQQESAVNSRWSRQFETVFGSNSGGTSFGMPSASSWADSTPHLLVTDAGPCVYFPVLTTELSADEITGSSSSDIGFFSTSGWLSGPNGAFPVAFSVASDSEQSIFFFSGLVPSQLVISPMAETDLEDGSPLPQPTELCLDGLMQLEACGDELDGVLAADGSVSAIALLNAMSDRDAQIKACWDAYRAAVEAAKTAKKNSIKAARDIRDAKKDAAKVTMVACGATAETAFLACLWLGGGASLGSLGTLTAGVVIACIAVKTAAITACATSFSQTCKAADAIYNIQVQPANATYQAAIQAAINARNLCLAQINEESSDTLCVLAPGLGKHALLAIETHLGCSEEIGSDYAACFSGTEAESMADSDYLSVVIACQID